MTNIKEQIHEIIEKRMKYFNEKFGRPFKGVDLEILEDCYDSLVLVVISLEKVGMTEEVVEYMGGILDAQIAVGAEIFERTMKNPFKDPERYSQVPDLDISEQWKYGLKS